LHSADDSRVAPDSIGCGPDRLISAEPRGLRRCAAAANPDARSLPSSSIFGRRPAWQSLFRK